MALKLGKKKPTNDGVKPKFSINFIEKIKQQINEFAQIFGNADKAKPYIYSAIICLVLSLVTLAYLFYSVPRNNELTRSVGELSLLSQIISRQATEATSSGTSEAIANLSASQKQFAESLQTVANIQGTSSEAYKNVANLWTDVSQNIDLISSQQKLINQLYDINIAVDETIPGVQAEYNLMVEQMARQGASSSQVIIAKNQVFIAERILRSISALLTGSENSKQSADDFSADVDTFGAYLNGQLNGNPDLAVVAINDPILRESLDSIATEFNEVLKPAASVVKQNASQIVRVRIASSQIFAKSDETLNKLDVLADESNSVFTNTLPALLMLIFLLLFVYAMSKLYVLRRIKEKQRVVSLQDEYDQNQHAILRLLDEIADLADGDLRSYATVSEDFTGAIADSINFAIDQLRELVSRINETSTEVARYTQDTQHITNQLAEASEHQAQEIAGASSAINEIAQSIDQVSSNATESAEVAQRSVQIASNGAEVVNRSIEGMDTIREQIQETSKRIKRLGESSQEIGNIVSLINDIADQTNILALNAAIQASMAGEAGRGFAVVADEVQRLAERSATATKQIENLVKTIQTDTNEAVISMEQTTSEVVKGANLAKDAGVALDEIQSVSNNLAKLIENISNAAKLQSSSASQIATTMSVVQEITSQTTSATFDTARSVGELANMAETLQQSVTNFKLPD